VINIVEFLVKMSKKEHSVAVRALATLLGATLFLAGIPALVFWVGRIWMSRPIELFLQSNIIAATCFVLGIPWLFSSIFWQLSRGKGTPVPIVPTKHFLQNGPYRFVRNPMILGFFLYLLGWAFYLDSWGSFAAAVAIELLLCLEIKFIEEPELTRRFGDAYREYKKETPFIIPKFKSRSGLIVVLVAVIIFLVIPFSIKLAFDARVSKVVGTKVSAGSLSVNPFKRQIDIKNIKIYQPAGFEKGVMTEIPLIRAELDPTLFRGGKLSVNTLTLEIPQLVVIKNEKGILNVNELKFAAYKSYVSVREFIFSAGSVIYIDHTAGPKPSVEGYQVNIYERHYKDLPGAKEIVSKMLGDILGRTAIKGVVIYGAATVAGASLMGPLAIPAVAGIMLTGQDSAEAVFHKSYDMVYKAADEVIKSLGDVNSEDKETGTIKGKVRGAGVTVSISKDKRNETSVTVSARKFLFPDSHTAAGVLYEISVKLK